MKLCHEPKPGGEKASCGAVHMMGSDGSTYCGAVRGERTKDPHRANCPICQEADRLWRADPRG